jgi:hypothetical protein
MLVSFGFSTVAVVMGDLLFLDPDPLAGQEGPERGVRLELRRINHSADRGTIYASRRITIDEPLWRVDLLESATGPVGTFDRTHHHMVDGWEVSDRIFDPELSADPVAWVRTALSSLQDVVLASIEPKLDPAELASIAAETPAICDQLERLLAAVGAGDLAPLPEGPLEPPVRAGWL